MTDHRADVYALGVVMYEMFTGRVPFEADSYMGVLTKHMYMAPTPPSQLTGTAELGAVEAILLRCLEKKAEHRYATLRDLITDLDRVLMTAGEPVSRPQSRLRAGSRSLLADELELPSREELELGLVSASRKPKAWWQLGVVGALFLAGLGAVFALRTAASRSSDLARSPSVSLPGSSPDSALRGTPTTAPLPELSSTATAALPAPAAASAASEIPAASALRRSSPLPRHTATVPATARKKGAQLGGSEIVDPWSKDDAR
jgi:serine/threonine protein kinase